MPHRPTCTCNLDGPDPSCPMHFGLQRPGDELFAKCICKWKHGRAVAEAHPECTVHGDRSES